jgi:PAS domain-containing protein
MMDLLSLVEHREAVQSHEKVGAVFNAFSDHGHEYVAVTDGEKLLGLCSRGQVGYLLGSRYGFSIFSDRPIRDHLMEHHLRLLHGTPVLAVLETALSRTGEQFYDDVALVDAEDQFLGMISVAKLICLQSCILADKAKLAEKQRRELEEKHRDLFRSLNELRQSQGCYAILFENAPLGVALLDPKGGIETANQRILSLLDAERSSAQASLAALAGH